MSHLKRPSPALLISIMALVAAIAVPAYALTKSEKKVVKKLTNAQITKRAPNLSVKKAASAETAASAGDTAEVHTPTRLVLSDPNPGDTDALEVDLLVAGPFTLEAGCALNLAGNPNDDRAIVRLSGPAGFSAGGVNSNGDGFDIDDVETLLLGVGDMNQTFISMDFHAVAPSGEVVTGAVSAEVYDPAGDCIFGATAVGP